jgi:hypothetical protein
LQFTKLGAIPHRIGDRLVWVVRSKIIGKVILKYQSWSLIFYLPTQEKTDIILQCINKKYLNFITCGCESSAHFLQFTKLGAIPHRIGDRLVWVVRSNDLVIFMWNEYSYTRKDRYNITMYQQKILGINWSIISFN